MRMDAATAYRAVLCGHKYKNLRTHASDAPIEQCTTHTRFLLEERMHEDSNGTRAT